MKQRLRTNIERALEACFGSGTLNSGIIPEIVLEVPNHIDHGDFATNDAMTKARAEKKAQR
ncbi:MAG: arginine--tRNA ligase, partial [Geoalkalibacter sp.]